MMKLKKTDKNSSLPVDEQSYKKAYLQRQIEEEETKKILRRWRGVLRDLKHFEDRDNETSL